MLISHMWQNDCVWMDLISWIQKKVQSKYDLHNRDGYMID